MMLYHSTNSSTDKSLYTPNDSIVNNSEDTLNRYKEACSRLINRNQINPNTLNEIVSLESVNILVLKPEQTNWLKSIKVNKALDHIGIRSQNGY